MIGPHTEIMAFVRPARRNFNSLQGQKNNNVPAGHIGILTKLKHNQKVRSSDEPLGNPFPAELELLVIVNVRTGMSEISSYFLSQKTWDKNSQPTTTFPRRYGFFCLQIIRPSPTLLEGPGSILKNSVSAMEIATQVV